jgi:hypothetical protein
MRENEDVELIERLGRLQRLANGSANRIGREVVLDRASVDRDGA